MPSSQTRWLTAGNSVLQAAPGHAEQVRRSLIDRLTPEQVTQLREISDAILANAEPLPEGFDDCGGCGSER
jgi:hypothetical protein